MGCRKQPVGLWRADAVDRGRGPTPLPAFLWVALLMAPQREWRKIGCTLGTAGEL